jgi:hypothetical protein
MDSFSVKFNRNSARDITGSLQGHIERRVGTENDCRQLSDTLKTFGFEVDVKENLIGTDLQFQMEQVANKLKGKDYQSLVVCILSHGFEGHVYGVDGVPVSISVLKNKFNSTDCPALHNKPKLFIIQACRDPAEAEGRPFCSRSNL